MIFFCLVTIRVIPRSFVQNIMRIFWVSQDNEKYITKMSPKILQISPCKARVTFHTICLYDCKNNSKSIHATFYEKISIHCQEKRKIPKMVLQKFQNIIQQRATPLYSFLIWGSLEYYQEYEWKVSKEFSRNKEKYSQNIKKFPKIAPSRRRHALKNLLLLQRKICTKIFEKGITLLRYLSYSGKRWFYFF